PTTDLGPVVGRLNAICVSAAIEPSTEHAWGFTVSRWTIRSGRRARERVGRTPAGKRQCVRLVASRHDTEYDRGDVSAVKAWFEQASEWLSESPSFTARMCEIGRARWILPSKPRMQLWPGRTPLQRVTPPSAHGSSKPLLRTPLPNVSVV